MYQNGKLNDNCKFACHCDVRCVCVFSVNVCVRVCVRVLVGVLCGCVRVLPLLYNRFIITDCNLF